jgi:ATP-dependent DNA helicase RecG
MCDCQAEDRVKSSVKTRVKSSVKILKLIRGNTNITIPEIARKIGLSTRAVEKQIAKLKEQEKIKRIGPDKGGYWEVVDSGN